MKYKIALIFIYNHPHVENIEILERIYKTRFSNIYHLVPFYQGKRFNVISVYGNSIYFQGYVSQGLKKFYKKNFTHYFFIADDLLLNPIINEKNCSKHLKLEKNTCFLSGFIDLHNMGYYWRRVSEAFYWGIHSLSNKTKTQLPNYNTALQALKKFGLNLGPISWKIPRSIKSFCGMLVRDKNSLICYFENKFLNKKYSLSYPLVGSYSDIFIMSANSIKQFCHYCAIFSTTNLHVEVALPTATVLTAKEIVTEKNLKLKGKALWTKEEHKILNKFEFNLKLLMKNFPKNWLYIHPIKLSKWK